MAADAPQGAITGFLRWWGRELAAFVPPAMGVWLGLFREQFAVVPEMDGLSLRRVVGQRELAIGQISQPQVAGTLARRRSRGAECVLRLPDEMGLQREAHVSAAALTTGRRAFAGEIERQTPFSPDKVDLGYVVTGKPDARGRVGVRFTVIPATAVDELLDAAAMFGVVPDRVSVGEPDMSGNTVRTLRVPPAGKTRLLAAVALVLVAIALASPFLRNTFAMSRIEAELTDARQRAALVARDEAAGKSDIAQREYLLRLRNGRAPVTEILDVITAALPDTAYVAQMNVTGKQVSLQGVARSASALVVPLEELPMIESASFGAPVLRDPDAGKEQFVLLLTLSGSEDLAADVP